MKQYITNSAQETKEVAGQIASSITGGVVTLSGELGAGKTTFTQGFAESLGITDKIISPTFVLVRQHQINNKKSYLFHIDLYRFEDSVDLKQLGFEDMISNKENIIIIEWPEKALEYLPKKKTEIKLEVLNNNQRKITVF
jgi:tRNA threonylcarbamoyladenosine biosynthesis protein TsaE